MSAIRKLIEASLDASVGHQPGNTEYTRLKGWKLLADAAEAELEEFEAGNTAKAMVQRDAYLVQLREARAPLSERDRADAELKAAYERWVSINGGWSLGVIGLDQFVPVMSRWAAKVGTK